MTKPANNNAALWFASDAYVVTPDKINGRRVAGASFLKGFVENAVVDKFQAVTPYPKQAVLFERMVRKLGGKTTKTRVLSQEHPEDMAQAGCVYYPSPTIGPLGWQRQHAGAGSYSLCGITHTTATKAVMGIIYDLRHSPVMAWDGVICTSQTVQDSVKSQFDDTDAYLRDRFGGTVPPRPYTPVIPLGIDTKAFVPAKGARGKARKDMGFGKSDVVFMTLSRLSPQEKFDPVPYYIALQAAQEQLSKQGLNLQVVMCGTLQKGYAANLFKDAAKALMPDVGIHFLDGAVAADRDKAFAVSDVFSFPIDSLQETFGLAPIEGMAAGMPVLCSDWNGMKDTVTPDVGIRVPTVMASEQTLVRDSDRYLRDADSYPQYLSQVSGVTVIDIPAWTDAIVALASSPEKRAKMGKAAQKRAQSVYDWSQVVPQMQDFWAVLAEHRLKDGGGHLATSPGHTRQVPVAPSPGRIFANYPTQLLSQTTTFQAHPDATLKRVDDIIRYHRYDLMGRKPTSRAVMLHLMKALQDTPATPVTVMDLSKRMGLKPEAVERGLLWLAKFNLALCNVDADTPS